MPLIPVAIVSSGFVDPVSTAPPVAGYVAWYDATDLSSVTVSGDNMKITAWEDKSGNNFDLAVISGRPVLLRTEGHRPVVFFDGLIGASPTQFNTASVSASDRTQTSFVVANVTSLDRTQALLGPSNDGGNGFLVNVTTGQLSTTRVDVGTIGTQSNASVTAGLPFVATQALTATDVTHYLNTTSELDSNSDAFTGSLSLRVGATPSAATPFSSLSGWIGEIIIYDTALSGGDITTTISHLMSKWEIA